MAPADPSIQNALLRSLSIADRTLLDPLPGVVPLPVRHSFESPGMPIANIYFMETGIASVVAVAPGEKRSEIGLVGREGMSGAAVVLGSSSSPHETYVQVAGTGRFFSADLIRQAMERSATLTTLFLKFTQTFMVQTAHTAVANARGTLEERLARWLLMTHDRLDGNELPLTHQFIALMLGVRRSGVTDSIANLEGCGMIRAQRGLIKVLDREALEKRANGLYGVPEREYRRLIG